MDMCILHACIYIILKYVKDEDLAQYFNVSPKQNQAKQVFLLDTVKWASMSS